jgi:hypothetical protein
VYGASGRNTRVRGGGMGDHRESVMMAPLWLKLFSLNADGTIVL